jgi:hypothetical protein
MIKWVLTLAIALFLVLLISIGNAWQPFATGFFFLRPGTDSTKADSTKADSTKSDNTKSAPASTAAGAVKKAPDHPVAKSDPAAEAGKASRAAEVTRDATAEAAEKGESVVGVVDAAERVARAYKLMANDVGSKVAQSIASVADEKRRTDALSNPQDVADEAKAWADAIQKAEAKSTARKTPDPASMTDSRTNLPNDLPPASATVAFESALPAGTSPALSAAGNYEYSIYGTVPVSDSAPKSSAFSTVPFKYCEPPPRPASDEHHPRRIGLFAVKYETPGHPRLAEDYARRAGWAGARAVQSQLVSLAHPGLGYSVSLRKDQSLVVGFCSFDDLGHHPSYNWVAFERDYRSPDKWNAYTIVPRFAQPGQRPGSPTTGVPAQTAPAVPPPASPDGDEERDLVKHATIDWFTDQRVSLGPEIHLLGSDPRGTLVREHDSWEELRSGSPYFNPDTHQSPTVRAVVSGDVITFSIEVAYTLYDSYRLAGEYQSSYFPPPASEARAALIEQLQYGAVKLRSTNSPRKETLERAAAYGADVLRRRGESLVGPEILRKERLGDNNHLVLVVRNARTGQTSWLGVTAAGQQGLTVMSRVQGTQEPRGHPLDHPALPASWLACPKMAPGGQAASFPLFLGGEEGSRLVEIWLVQKQRDEDLFKVAPTPLFDVQYMFLLPQ